MDCKALANSLSYDEAKELIPALEERCARDEKVTEAEWDLFLTRHYSEFIKAVMKRTGMSQKNAERICMGLTDELNGKR